MIDLKMVRACIRSLANDVAYGNSDYIFINSITRHGVTEYSLTVSMLNIKIVIADYERIEHVKSDDPCLVNDDEIRLILIAIRVAIKSGRNRKCPDNDGDAFEAILNRLYLGGRCNDSR